MSIICEGWTPVFAAQTGDKFHLFLSVDVSVFQPKALKSAQALVDGGPPQPGHVNPTRQQYTIQSSQDTLEPKFQEHEGEVN